MTEADLEGGLRLSRASGWNQTLADWRLLLSLGPGLFRVALRDSEVVASGGAVRYGEALAWICMILVRPDERGHGLGTRVFDEVLERASAARERRAAPSSRPRRDARGPRPLPATRLPGRSRPRASARWSRGAASGTNSRPGERRPPLRARRRSRARPGGLRRRPKPRPARARGPAPELARTLWDGERVRGYCFGRHGDHADQLGPVVADDAAPRTISSGPSSPVRAAGRSSSTRAPFPAGSRRSATSGSASSARSRACTWARRGLPRARSASSPSSDRSSDEARRG